MKADFSAAEPHACRTASFNSLSRFQDTSCTNTWTGTIKGLTVSCQDTYLCFTFGLGVNSSLQSRIIHQPLRRRTLTASALISVWQSVQGYACLHQCLGCPKTLPPLWPPVLLQGNLTAGPTLLLSSRGTQCSRLSAFVSLALSFRLLPPSRSVNNATSKHSSNEQNHAVCS